MLDAIIFDYDQTLVCSLRRFYLTFNTCLQQLGSRPLRYKEFLISYSADSLGSYIPGEISAEDFWAEFLRSFDRTPMELTSLMPGAKDVLTLLKASGFKIVVVTGRLTPRQKFLAELRQLSVSNLIDVAATRSTAGNALSFRSKALAVAKAIDTLGSNPERCIFVGDYHEDMMAASLIGALPIGVLSGLMSEEVLKLAGAKYVIENVARLPDLLKKELNCTLNLSSKL